MTNQGAARLLLKQPRVFWGKVVWVFIARGWSPPKPDERITQDLLEEFEKIEYVGSLPVDLPDAGDSEPLTEREQQIVKLLVVGYANAEIAKTLGIGNRTVRFHLSNVYRKLGVSTRTQVVAMFHADRSTIPDA